MSDISKTLDVYRDFNHDPVASEGDIPTISDHSMDADELALVALGYKQEFKREFSLWTIFSLSFAVLGLLPSFASTMAYGGSGKRRSHWSRDILT
jgi:hypothetical protein